MFGYVTVNQAELKFREYDWYHSFYCGLCRTLRENYGLRGQLTLTYDMTFLVILLNGLYEPDTPVVTRRCETHPLHKHAERKNKYTRYAADMNILLAYYQCLDDWRDDKNVAKKLMSTALKNAFLRVKKAYPRKAEMVAACLGQITRCEEENDPDIDRASGLFGQLTAEIFAVKQDEWEKDLRTMGFYLGKFIYLMDAWEDMEKDEKSGSYNPLLLKKREGATDEDCEEIMNMMMAECCRAFEHLPIITGVEVLRNILYSGVWSRFELVRLKRLSRNGKTEKPEEKASEES